MERRPLAKTVGQIAGSALPPHISIMGNHFTLVDGSGTRVRYPNIDLDCVILDINEAMSRIYWGRDYTGEESEGPPLCFSDNGIAPSTRSQEPQAKSCRPDASGEKGCRWSVWGSATSKLTGEQIPACQNGIKLAIVCVKVKNKVWVPALPGDNARMVFFLRVPPASLGAIATYGKKVAGMTKLTIPWTGEEVASDLNYVVTRVSFVPKTQGKIQFESVGYITEEIDNIIEAVDQEKVDVAIGRGDEPITALPAPKAAAAIAAPASEAPKKRGRPAKGSGPASGGASLPAESTFQPRPNPNIVTTEDVQRDIEARQTTAGVRAKISEYAARQDARMEQEGREAASSKELLSQFGMQESAPPPPKQDQEPLDEFMNLELK